MPPSSALSYCSFPDFKSVDKMRELVRLKVEYHTESRLQHQPASFSSAFKLSGTACLMGVGDGVWGVPSSDWGHVMKEVTSSPHPLLLLLYHITPLQGVLTPFTNYLCSKRQSLAPPWGNRHQPTPYCWGIGPLWSSGHTDHLTHLVPYQGKCISHGGG